MTHPKNRRKPETERHYSPGNCLGQGASDCETYGYPPEEPGGTAYAPQGAASDDSKGEKPPRSIQRGNGSSGRY